MELAGEGGTICFNLLLIELVSWARERNQRRPPAGRGAAAHAPARNSNKRLPRVRIQILSRRRCLPGGLIGSSAGPRVASDEGKDSKTVRRGRHNMPGGELNASDMPDPACGIWREQHASNYSRAGQSTGGRRAGGGGPGGSWAKLLKHDRANVHIVHCRREQTTGSRDLSVGGGRDWQQIGGRRIHRSSDGCDFKTLSPRTLTPDLMEVRGPLSIGHCRQQEVCLCRVAARVAQRWPAREIDGPSAAHFRWLAGRREELPAGRSGRVPLSSAAQVDAA